MTFSSHGRKLYSIIAGFVFMLAVISSTDAGSEGRDAYDIYHMPENPRYDGPAEVFLKIQNISGISSVQIFACSMEPVFCFYADKMDYVGNNTFSKTMELDHMDFEKGDFLGYNFKIMYENSTAQKLPDSLTFEDYDNIIEVGDGIYYFTFLLQGNNASEIKNSGSLFSLSLFLIVISSAFVLIMIAILLKRRKTTHEKQDDTEKINNW